MIDWKSRLDYTWLHPSVEAPHTTRTKTMLIPIPTFSRQRLTGHERTNQLMVP
jgi:hypothetical protein